MPATASEIEELVKRQRYRCALSGRQLDPQIASLDHILPVSRGGDNEVRNLQVLHKDVNMAKGSMTTTEFISLCREVASHTIGFDADDGDDSGADVAISDGSFLRD